MRSFEVAAPAPGSGKRNGLTGLLGPPRGNRPVGRELLGVFQPENRPTIFVRGEVRRLAESRVGRHPEPPTAPLLTVPPVMVYVVPAVTWTR